MNKCVNIAQRIYRFLQYVNKTKSCWLWTGGKTHNGYGVFQIAEYTPGRAHRFSYEAFKGPIPNGLQIDHLCCVKACVNPDHLEVVTPKENTLRALKGSAPYDRTRYCLRGHEYTTENTRIVHRKSWPYKVCRKCVRLYRRAHKDKLNLRRMIFRKERSRG